MTVFRRCDYCGKQARVESLESSGWLRLEGVEGARRSFRGYPPLPCDFHSWECAANYTAHVLGRPVAEAPQRSA